MKMMMINITLYDYFDGKKHIFWEREIYRSELDYMKRGLALFFFFLYLLHPG